MSQHKIRVAITHGDINGISYEVLLKIFEDERITELFTPILYGSSRVASFWKERLALEQVSWHTIRLASEDSVIFWSQPRSTRLRCLETFSPTRDTPITSRRLQPVLQASPSWY